MMPPEFFSLTAPGLLPTLAELTAREPIFHCPRYHTVMATEFWEVGASGRRYSRKFILGRFADEPPIETEAAGWRTFDHQVRRLASDTFLFTHTLHQGDRRSRRATIWQSAPSGWQVLYHQGTLITAEENDIAPLKLNAQS